MTLLHLRRAVASCQGKGYVFTYPLVGELEKKVSRAQWLQQKSTFSIWKAFQVAKELVDSASQMNPLNWQELAPLSCRHCFAVYRLVPVDSSKNVVRLCRRGF